MSEEKTEKRVPVKRWIVLGLIVLGAYAAFFGPTILRPTSPAVVLPGEPTGLAIGGFQITNTVLATLLTDLILILMALAVVRFTRRGSLVPTGFYNAFETIMEFLWSSVQGSATLKWARRIFPIVATIFLLIFVANMVKLVPGFESIGYLKERHEGTGYAAVRLGPVWVLDKGQPVPAEPAAEGEATHETAANGAPCKSCEVVPYLRGAATDLNFPFALAVIAVVHHRGVWDLGFGPRLPGEILPVPPAVQRRHVRPDRLRRRVPRADP